MNPEELFQTIRVEMKSDMQKIEEMFEAQEFNRIHSTFFERITILLISALGLVAALAWDEAFKEAFVRFIKPLDSFGGKFLYAVLITVVAVILSIVLTKIFLKKKSK